MNVLVVDDEELARKRLRRMLEPYEKKGRLSIVAEAEDGFAALGLLEKHKVDLLFLDIKMPELDGFGVIERIHPEKRPRIVFTTAFNDYAIQAFDASAVDYLLKPIGEDRLEAAIKKAEASMTVAEPQSINDERIGKLLDWIDKTSLGPEEPVEKRDEPIKYLSVPYRDRILIIPTDRLVSIEISEGITRVYVVEEHQEGPKPKIRQHIVAYTLEQLEGHLDSEEFLRIHRSTIVQVSHILEMIPWFSGRYKLVMTGGHEVISSRERSKVLKEKLVI